VDAVLTATAQILRERGPEGATTNRIADRAGVSIGSLYQYFPNKTALFTALAEAHVKRLEASVETQMQEIASASAEELFPSAVESFFSMIRVDAKLHAALQRVSLWGLTSGVMGGFRIRVEERMGLLLAARAADLLVPLEDPEMTARVIVRAIGGIMDASILEDPAAADDPRLLREVTRLVAARFGY
jgi:AcrR family transcriptional regulator